MKPIYLDYNATTPIDREAAIAMEPYLFEHFGNPSSSHAFGAAAKKAVEAARAQVAGLLGCAPHEVVFTSGGTESNNMAIKGVALARRERGNHVITSAVEHPAVTEVCQWLKKQGFRITILPVDGDGLVDPADLKRAIDAQTILVTVMHANNEVGTIQPIAELAAIAHAHGCLMHTDAAQSAGKIPVNVNDLGCDLLSLAGHKVYAPKGVGALYIRGGSIPLEALLHGAGHEAGRRPGTENVLEIVGLGRACEIAGQSLDKNRAHLRAMRDRLHAAVAERIGEERCRLNGHKELRLPNTLSLSFRGIDAGTLVSEIGNEVAVSAGAACHAGETHISAVLSAMEVPEDWALGTVRFSTGRETTAEDVDRAAEVVAVAVRRLLPEAGAAAAAVELPAGGEIKLTRFTHGMGCACKLRPQDLEKILAGLPRPVEPALLVGAETADDAAVWRLDGETAIVQTVDFFTPIVDDPYLFGAISAANSLSDVYAMGGRPLFALSIVAFPAKRLPLSVLQAILAGGQDKAAEAGISIVGGHTIEDPEPKFGLVVTGAVHPDRVWRNSTARPQDTLVLTKPLGTGILSTAVKRGLAEPHDARAAADLMAELNKAAAEAAAEYEPSACTDVTGFGLLGHLREMAAASRVDVRLSCSAVPKLAAAAGFAAAGVVPGGTLNNLAHVTPHVDFAASVSEPERLILADAQTSGGLLLSLPAGRATEYVSKLKRQGNSTVTIIGEVTGKGTGRIGVNA